jgi:hypothetical protein
MQYSCHDHPASTWHASSDAVFASRTDILVIDRPVSHSGTLRPLDYIVTAFVVSSDDVSRSCRIRNGIDPLHSTLEGKAEGKYPRSILNSALTGDQRTSDELFWKKNVRVAGRDLQNRCVPFSNDVTVIENLRMADGRPRKPKSDSRSIRRRE